MACHLIAFAGLVVPIGNVIGPLVMWLIKQDEMPLVNDQGKESLNFQITITLVVFALAIIAAAIFPIPIIGWLFKALLGIAAAAIGVYALVMVISAAVKAKEGVSFRYPISLRFIK